MGVRKYAEDTRRTFTYDFDLSPCAYVVCIYVYTCSRVYILNQHIKYVCVCCTVSYRHLAQFARSIT